MTLQEVAAEVARQSELKADYVADTRLLSFSSNGQSEVALDDPQMGLIVSSVRDHAHGQIATHLGVPKTYYDRMREEAPSLLDSNVNHWFQQKHSKRMLRTLDGDLRAFVSDGYRRLDNDELVQMLLPILGEMGDIEFKSCNLTESKLYIKVVLPRLEAEVNVGDPMQYGVVIQNSEVGAGRLLIAPFTFVLSCKNGMTFEQFGTAKTHVGRRVEAEEESFRIFRDETIAADDRAFWMKAQDALRAAVNETLFNDIVARSKEARGIFVDAPPPQAVEKLGKKLSLTEGEQADVLQHLITGGDLSAWGYANAITRTASDSESYDRASELERLGGRVVEEAESLLAVAA